MPAPHLRAHARALGLSARPACSLSANGVLLAREVPNSRLVVLVPGEGHLLLFDLESSALPALAEFFADGEQSPTWREAER